MTGVPGGRVPERIRSKSSEVILVVAEEDMVRELARTTLDESGYVVLEARDAREGLALCAGHQGPIDLLVTDLTMAELNGHELASEPDELKKHLGFMPDFCPTYDQLTASEFLDHFARAYNVPDRASRIDKCLEVTWLTDKRDALCEELSRGMKQRLVLAKTLLPDPQVLLLDEPASGLDPLGRIELRKILLQLRDAGKAILISSHILTELSGFCNMAAIMERGRLVKFGSIAELGQQMASRRMSVKWRADGGKALEILKVANVKNLNAADLGATFDFDANTDALDALLKTLVVQGVRVCECRGSGD